MKVRRRRGSIWKGKGAGRHKESGGNPLYSGFFQDHSAIISSQTAEKLVDDFIEEIGELSVR